ncbi:MAG TPA: sigma-70 family RNA polymerase sigma factor [Actinomycetes bacterium]|jgi:RNA polymerase sigma factor (sigma-70 family)|nr:sigma-70 family RNA polymerase sigma factor [Actinomycetes bacterium]
MDEEDLREAVRAAADGDGGAWSRLVERFGSLVWSVLRAYGLAEADAADVFQTTWLRLVEHLGGIQNPGGVGAWLTTTARRESLRVLRAGSRMVPTEDLTKLEAPGPDWPTPEALWLGTERSAELWRALLTLTARCQQLLRVLMASPPPSYAEVAAALDMPIGSIGPVRRRCLEQLRRRLK